MLSRKGFANLAIEGELAVELSREPAGEDFSEAEIPACVARVFPVDKSCCVRVDAPPFGSVEVKFVS